MGEIALTIEDFENMESVVNVAKQAEGFRNSGRYISDTIDKDGHQYVDLVQEGGGVLGIALVGYTWAMEQAGIRFFSLAGTSAGAINTMLLAAIGSFSQPKSEEILKILCDKNMFDFVDGDRYVKNLIQDYIRDKNIYGKIIYKTKLVLNFLKIKSLLLEAKGLNPGDDFRLWLSNILSIHGCSTLSELSRKRTITDKSYFEYRGNNLEDFRLIPHLKIIASEITTQTKACFPEMADLYWDEAKLERVNPADFVRASMSIPFFFEPFKVFQVPKDDAAKKRWKDRTGFEGDVLPGTVTFVDGGLLSNFPIKNLINAELVPCRPTFGVRLSAYRENLNNTETLPSYIGAMLNTMRHISDYDFLLENPMYHSLICRLDTDNDFNWLDFNMNNENKLKLFEIGAKKAMDFLGNFDWDNYKVVRSNIVNSVSIPWSSVIG